MAERTFRHNVGTQNHEGAAFYRGFKQITQITYPSAGENMVGERLFGDDDLGTDGLHHEKFFHTGLQGQAAVVPDKVRQRFPMASYRTGSILIQGYRQIGIAYEYYPEDLEDNLPGFDFLAGFASDLPVLLRDTEEDMHLSFYNNGESATQLVGHANTPLFVATGSGYSLQLLGNPTYFSGIAASNVIENGGGISYAMLSLVKQYGRNFINEEGRSNPIRPVAALGREQNIELLSEWLTAPSNIEQFDGARRNPAADMNLTLLSSERLAQPNDLIFFFDGWENDIKMRAKYQNKADSWQEGHAQYRKVYSQTRSRLGYYAYNNRRVLLVRGAA